MRRIRGAAQSGDSIRQRRAIDELEDRLVLTFTVNHTPYLQLGNAPLTGYNGGFDQAEVIWQTTGTQDTDTFTAQVRETGTIPWTSVGLNAQIVTGVGGRINHSVTFTGLNFNDDYDYLVTHLRGGNPIATYQSTFHTRLNSSDTSAFTFVTYGDSASGDPPTNFINVQNRINLINPAFSLLLGDNVYSTGTHAEYDLRLDPSKNAALTTYNKDHIDYFAFGNHDVGAANGQAAKDNYSNPIPVQDVTSGAGIVFDSNVEAEKNYSYDYGGVHFVTFDTNNWQNTAALDKQLNWAVADILAARARANPPKWVIVFGHHPITSLSGHTEHTPDDYYYDQVLARLGHGPGGVGVDLLLFGHAHNYQRSYPLTGHVGATATFVLDTDNNYAKGAGLPLIIQGTGGVGLGYGANDATFSGSYLAKAMDSNTSVAAQYGFGRVDVTSTQITYSYINALGQVLDSFTITAGPDVKGPMASLTTPQDNGLSDQDSTAGQVQVNSPQSTIQIQLSDIGDGVDDSTVASSAFTLARNGQVLLVGTHYTYAYNATTNIVTLTPIGTSFGTGTYVVSVSSAIKDIAGNSMSATSLTVTVVQLSEITVSFRNGENGYGGAKDTYLHEDAPTTDFGAAVKVYSDGDDDLGTAETPPQRVEGMIRFDAMFDTTSGSRGGGPIPDFSTITSATLTVKTGTASGDESPAGNYFTLHRMIATWGESSTWDSMVGGVSLDDVEASASATAFVNGPSVLGGTVSFDLTSDVQLWSSNNTLSLRGWVVYPAVGTNGWWFDSSNATTVANRPILTVKYLAGPSDVLAGGPYYVNEGSGLTLGGSATGSGLTYSWDLNGDDNFTDASGTSPTLTWAQLVALGINDGPTTRVVRLRVDDGLGHQVDDSTWLTVVNAAPSSSISGLTSVVRGESVVYTLQATDASPVDQASDFDFYVDWEGDGGWDTYVHGPSGSTTTHVFGTNGSYNVKILALDKDAWASGITTLPVTVSTWLTRPNTGNPLLTDLVYGGAASGSVLYFEGTAPNTVQVTDLTTSTVVAGPISGITGDVVFWGQNGIEVLYVSGLNGMTARLAGGSDSVKGAASGGTYSFVGGDGDDSVLFFSAAGANLSMDGETGNDSLAVATGSSGQYTLIGGTENDSLILLDGANVQLTMDGGTGDDEVIVGGDTNATISLTGGLGMDNYAVYGGDNLAITMNTGEDDDVAVNLATNSTFNVDLGGGNDLLLNLEASTNMTVVGGSGDDVIAGVGGTDSIDGGTGNDLLVGGVIAGDGNDTILGGDGADVIVGGYGADSLTGGNGEDLMIAGLLSESFFGDEAVPGVLQVWQQWTTADPFATRIAYLTGTPGGIVDPAYYLAAGTTVLNDGSVDTVLGEGDSDWLLYDFSTDIATDYTAGVDSRIDL